MNSSEDKNTHDNFGGSAVLQLIAKPKGGDTLMTLIFECHKTWRGFIRATNDDAYFVSLGFITVYRLRQSFMGMMRELDIALEQVGCPKEDGSDIIVKGI
jgi:hypothetical protein